MPITPTYPGVYVEEVPSGVRTITGVATSTAAFIGRSRRGPVNEPIVIHSFADFERNFGGLSVDDPMGYSVRDFYLNGGSTAVIVRVHRGATAATVTLPAGDETLDLVASSPGSWGNALTVIVDHETKDTADARLFNLTIQDGAGTLEKHLNVSVDASYVRYVARVLEQSSLVRVVVDQAGVAAVPSARPTEGTAQAEANSGNDGEALTANEISGPGSEQEKRGLYALEKTDLFNLLCVPPLSRGGDTPATVYQAAMNYCVKRRAMLIVDPPASWSANRDRAAQNALGGLSGLGLSGEAARNAALYFPRVREADPLRQGQIESFVPCGLVAGVMARTDAGRGVWKAPAGLDAALNGVQGLDVNLTDAENGSLNPRGINCLRSLAGSGRVVWGARTMRGADQHADEYKYVPVRRLALFIEESLYRGTQWVVFEPNDEPLWAQIRLNVSAFMHDLFRQGAFQGTSPREAYFVKCDRETTTQNDINKGIVNIVVGFAPLKPAEFVIIRIQQIAGQGEA